MTEVAKTIDTKWTSTVSTSFQDLEQLIKQIKLNQEVDLEKVAANYEDCLRRVDEVITGLDSSQEEETPRKMEKKTIHWQHSLEQQVAEDLRQRQAEEMRRSRVDFSDSTPSTSMSSSSSSASSGRGKMTLAEWKYSELRETINSSSDLELLLACKEEFHRRLRIYNLWKEKQFGRDLIPQRSPFGVFQAVSQPATPPPRAAPHVNPALTASRYFKVAFIRPADIYKEQQTVVSGGPGPTGIWYGHFNGQWAQRQLELQPEKKPSLLVAGQDDLQMCEMPLDQTGLTRRKAAEITEHEFETVWAHYGGKPLPRWCP